MSTIIQKEEEEPVDRLLKLTMNIRGLHEDVCVTEHALYEKGQRFIPYEPTFFLYNYFCLNVIFDIDWESSADCGSIIYYEKKGKKVSEKDKIKRLINFCFSKDGFVLPFIPTFRRIVTIKYDTQAILESMKGIIPDYVEVDDTFIGTFQAACMRVLEDPVIQLEDIKTVFSFIYAVRCNIVHGTKTMQHMRDSGQRKRITTYSYFIVGLLHMLFMRLEFESYGYYSKDIREKSENFLYRIANTRTSPLEYERRRCEKCLKKNNTNS